MSPEDGYVAARQAAHEAAEAESIAVSRYEAGAGIRPPRRSGKARGVLREIVPGGGMEIWHCEHDHAPRVHDCRQLSAEQRAEAVACARNWAGGQIAAGHLYPWPVRDEPE